MARMFVDGRWQDVSGDQYYTPPPSWNQQGSPGYVPAPPAKAPPPTPYTPLRPTVPPNTGGAKFNFSPLGRINAGQAQVLRSQTPQYPTLERGNAPPMSRFVTPSYAPPSRTSDSSARGAINRLQSITLPDMPREGLPAAPARTADYGGLPQAPNRIGSASGLPPAPSRGNLDALIAKLSQGMQLSPAEREQLGQAAPDNVWESLALDRFKGGSMDPGQQYKGRELADQIFSKDDINAMAGQRSAGTIRAFKDAEQMAAQAAGANGLSPEKLAALRARAAIEGAGALQGAYRDAQLEAASANAQQAALAAANNRSNFETDINARLGLGKLNLDTGTQLASTGLARRNIDQTRDITRYQGDITQRGQDLARDQANANLNLDATRAALEGELGGRAQDIGYAVEGGRQGIETRGQDIAQRGQDIGYAVEGGRQGIETRGQDVTQRGQDIGYAETGAQLNVQQRAQDLEQQYRAAGLSAEQARARVQAELGLREQTIGENLGIGQQTLAARGQDINANITQRGQDIDRELGLGRLNVDQYRAQADVANAIAERTTRLDSLDAQLQDASIDRNTRAQLEQQRMQLERELAQLQTQQRESEFSRNYGLEGQRLQLQAAGLNEQGRQADNRYQQDAAQQDLQRYIAELQNKLGQGRLNIDYAAADHAGYFGGQEQLNPQELQLIRRLAQFAQQAA